VKLAIVTPVFNDWASLAQLIGALENIGDSNDLQLFLFAVDDGSTEAKLIDYPLQTLRRIREVEIIDLICNLGHQRAIAVGLVEMYERDEFDAILVMDADGEDRPDDIPRLIDELLRQPGHIVCAQRRQRPGLLLFRAWYGCYKAIFRLLTGARIDFGNFCLIPNGRLEAIVSNSSLWNHLAGTLARSKLPLARLPLDRGRRYAGNSKMNFVSLVMHGLSAIAVYSDIVMVRLLLVTLAVSAITICGVVWVSVEKLFTTLAIPGWATSAAGILLVILAQALMLFTIACFNIINARSAKVVIPRLDALSFVSSRRKLLSVKVVGEVAE
jgi:glycosyltransferase involved in cell wall biosynthesis